MFVVARATLACMFDIHRQIYVDICRWCMLAVGEGWFQQGGRWHDHHTAIACRDRHCAHVSGGFCRDGVALACLRHGALVDMRCCVSVVNAGNEVLLGHTRR